MQPNELILQILRTMTLMMIVCVMDDDDYAIDDDYDEYDDMCMSVLIYFYDELI
jgi:hypothetical protein